MTGWVVLLREGGKVSLYQIKHSEPEARRVAAGLAGQATYAGRIVRVDVVRVEVEVPPA